MRRSPKGSSPPALPEAVGPVFGAKLTPAAGEVAIKNDSIGSLAVENPLPLDTENWLTHHAQNDNRERGGHTPRSPLTP